jgi:uncharacterized repeat protein (TIGR01451 family)
VFKSVKKSGALGVLLLVAVVGANQAQAAGVLAGTDIENVAEVSYTIGTVSTTTPSNPVTLRVAEVLDVNVTSQAPTTGVPVDAGDTQRVVRYVVTNTGNAAETFLLVTTSTIAGDDFDPVQSSPSIYLDRDNNGLISAPDEVYVPGSNDPDLAADASISVLVVNNIPAGLVDNNQGLTRLTASARTGTGAAGTVVVNGGNGVSGRVVDAIVGANGADDEDTGFYVVRGVSLTAVKTQSVLDQFNGSSPVPGARVTYSIVVNMTGSGTATDAVFTDEIPAGTTYVAGSLTLNAQPRTDAVGDDDAEFIAAGPARVRVDLGDLQSTSGPQTITFAVTINTN